MICVGRLIDKSRNVQFVGDHSDYLFNYSNIVFCPLCTKVTSMKLKSYLERYEMSKCQKVLFVFKHREVIGQFLSETSVSSQIKLHASYIRQFKKVFE